MPETEIRFLSEDKRPTGFFTPTEMGNKVSPQLSSKKFNSLLESRGFQRRNEYMPGRFTYRIKPLGEQIGARYGAKDPSKPDDCEWRTIWPISILQELQLKHYHKIVLHEHGGCHSVRTHAE